MARSYLVLLLEFQSRADQYMALRVLIYAALLWQQLEREGRLAADGSLPPLLPVVVYNGDARWELRKLVGLAPGSSLWRWQPQLAYHLIDAGAFTAADLAAREGLPPMWFRLEAAADTGDAVAVADAVLAWFRLHPGYAAARAVFAELLGAMVAPLSPGIRVPEDLQEIRGRLVTRAEQWAREWKEEGLQLGLQQGLAEGRQLGALEGQRKGEATLLLRQMERRFGALPAWATDRVLAADTGALEEWGLRILDAANVEDMLGSSA